MALGFLSSDDVRLNDRSAGDVWLNDVSPNDVRLNDRSAGDAWLNDV